MPAEPSPSALRRADPDATSLLAQHSRVHRRMGALAAARLADGELEEAAVYAQAAAEYAWINHPGRFADRDLEAAVREIAEGLFIDPSPVANPSSQPESVLHVVTQAYELFGHTRLCWRWIEADRERRHSVALTNQGLHPVPGPLVEGSAATGGRILELSGAPGGILERARRLRDHAQEHEAVVLHVHPYDVVSAIAFALPGPAPVLFLNHAEHVFWLGVGSADLFVHIREAGADLAAARRGVGRERSALLPIPLAAASDSGQPRDETRRALGIGPDDTMFLTVANAYKYVGNDGNGYLSTVAATLSNLPSTKLMAVGPSDEGPWASARASTQGRVRALGTRSDVPALLEAADVYLDSFPMSSVTSLLEAGRAGLPLLRLLPSADPVVTFEPGLATLRPHLIEAPDRTAFHEALAALVEDPARRRELGARTRAAVVGAHVGEGWLSQLTEVYARAAAASLAPRPVAPPVEPPALGPVDRGLSALNARGDSHAGFFVLLPAQCRLLPRRAAIRMWIEFVAAMREDIWDPPRIGLAARRAWARRRGRSAGAPG